MNLSGTLAIFNFKNIVILVCAVLTLISLLKTRKGLVTKKEKITNTIIIIITFLVILIAFNVDLS